MIGVPCDLTSIDCAKKIVTSSALDCDVKFQNCVVRGQAGIDPEGDFIGSSLLMGRQHKITRYEMNAAECDMLAGLAVNQFERILYQRVAAHFREFANNLRSDVSQDCGGIFISCDQFAELEGDYDVGAIPQNVFVGSGRGSVIVFPGRIRSRS